MPQNPFLKNARKSHIFNDECDASIGFQSLSQIPWSNNCKDDVNAVCPHSGELGLSCHAEREKPVDNAENNSNQDASHGQRRPNTISSLRAALYTSQEPLDFTLSRPHLQDIVRSGAPISMEEPDEPDEQWLMSFGA